MNHSTKGVGSASALIVEHMVSKIEKSRKHKSAKLVEHYLVGFNPESEVWLRFILEAFTEIFLR